MAKTRLHLKTRDEFAALSLHEKNDYLQGVAQQIAATIAPIAPVVIRERSVIRDQPLSADG